MKTQKNKFKPLQAGITKHIKTDKPVLYLEFYLGDVAYCIYEFLPKEHQLYYRLNTLDLVIKYFGGVRGLRSLEKKLTADRVLEIVYKPKNYCDA